MPSDGRTCSEHRPEGATRVVPPRSKLGVVPCQVCGASNWKPRPRPSLGVMGPEQPGLRHTAKCRDVTATDGPSQYLRLQIFGRVQKYSIGTGLEPQMANE